MMDPNDDQNQNPGVSSDMPSGDVPADNGVGSDAGDAPVAPVEGGTDVPAAEPEVPADEAGDEGAGDTGMPA